MKRTLGKSGMEVSAMGMGCWAIGGPWTFSNDEGSWAAGWGEIDDDIRHRLSFKDGAGAELLSQLEEVRDVLTANGHTLAQASLAYIWALDERMVPIPGFKSVEQVQENAQAMELGPLSDEQMKQIKIILERKDSGKQL